MSAEGKSNSSKSNMKLFIVLALFAVCVFLYMNGIGFKLPSLDITPQVLGPNSETFVQQSYQQPVPQNYQQPAYNQPATVVVLPPTDNGKQFVKSLAGSCNNGKYHIVIWYSDNSTAEYDANC